MKRALYFVTIVLMVMSAAAIGCGSAPAETEPEIEISPAPVHEIRVKFDTESDPVQVFVYIKVGLRDSCTTFHELGTVRSSNTTYITVTTQRPKDATCAQVYGYFEKNMDLGSNFVPRDLYGVYVNDEFISFRVPDSTKPSDEECPTCPE